MRYRGGGKIGAFTDLKPQNYNGAAKGCWKLGEACQWLEVDRWPRRIISIDSMPAYVDTTKGHFGEIKPSITSTYNYGVIRWQFSDDGGATWNEKPNNDDHVVNTDFGYGWGWLTLSNQWRNLSSTPPYNDINGGLPVDGRLWRVIVTCGLRSRRSDYFDEIDQTWKGRCEEWNDRVVVSFSMHPQAPVGDVRVGDGVPFTAQASGVGQDHGLTYEVAYRWQTSTNGTTWSTIQNQDFYNPAVIFVPPFQGGTYIRSMAIFSYSDPINGRIVTGRPDVYGYSDHVFLNVLPST